MWDFELNIAGHRFLGRVPDLLVRRRRPRGLRRRPAPLAQPA